MNIDNELRILEAALTKVLSTANVLQTREIVRADEALKSIRTKYRKSTGQDKTDQLGLFP